MVVDSSDFVSIDMETIPLSPKDHIVKTGHGSVSVAVFGDPDKPALITYPDVALNHMSCFQGFFLCPEAFSLLVHNFCIYHISPPGHELGAAEMSYDDPVLSVDDLADQVAEVLDYFGLGAVMCMGVTAGAYILTLFAIKYTRRVLGLILISPLCKTPSWTEWLYNKVMSNVLYYYGMCCVVKELLLMRYISKLLDERQSPNVLQFLEAINRRPDITVGLRKLHCRSLIFVGENSPFHFEALHMTSKLDRRFSALVEETYANKLREANGLEPADPVNGVDDPGLKLYEEAVGGVKKGRLPGRPNEKWSKKFGHVSSSDFVTQVALQQSSQEVKKLKEQLAESERKRLRNERNHRRYEANQNANYQMLYEYMVCQAAKHGDPPPPRPLNFNANSGSEGASNTRNDSSPTNHGDDEIGDYYETPDDEMGTDDNETSDDEMGEDEMGEH